MSSILYHITCPKCGCVNACKDVDKYEGTSFYCMDCPWTGDPPLVEKQKFYPINWSLLEDVKIIKEPFEVPESDMAFRCPMCGDDLEPWTSCEKCKKK